MSKFPQATNHVLYNIYPPPPLINCLFKQLKKACVHWDCDNPSPCSSSSRNSKNNGESKPPRLFIVAARTRLRGQVRPDERHFFARLLSSPFTPPPFPPPPDANARRSLGGGDTRRGGGWAQRRDTEPAPGFFKKHAQRIFFIREALFLATLREVAGIVET
jgi:hypothetical protein